MCFLKDNFFPNKLFQSSTSVVVSISKSCLVVCLGEVFFLNLHWFFLLLNAEKPAKMEYLQNNGFG